MSFLNNQKALIFAFTYTLFIIYGSLVPLDYKAIPFEQALSSFSHIRYLSLGAASRADWIANIVLYVPLTFSLAAISLSSNKTPFKIIFYSALILISSIALAITIEFYQQFFPPRTVSQNDLIAETIGSIIGLVLWLSYGKRFIKLYSHIQIGGRPALLACAVLYTISYITLSLFPYDFVTSLQELKDKLAHGSDAFFLSSSCGGFILCSTKLATESLLTLPLGIFFSILLKWHPKRLTAIVLLGFILGLVIESIQLFIISGVAQSISIIARIVGMCTGEALYKKISSLEEPFKFLDSIFLRKHIIIASLPYILLLAYLNGWSIDKESFNSDISASFKSIYWLPFYYHYYTTEAIALTSLLRIFAMYTPIGICAWLWNFNNRNSLDKNFKLNAGLYAVYLCFILEAGKLFFLLKHPDPTNLIISFASAIISYSLIETMYHWFHQSETNPVIHKNDLSRTSDKAPTKVKQTNTHYFQTEETANVFAKSIAFTLFFLLLWKITNYPENSVILFSILFLYGLLLRKYPTSWIIVIPAIIPLSDFSPWTGRFFFSEFDYFILVTLIVSLWFKRWKFTFLLQSKSTTLLLLYIAFYLISFTKGLFPLQTVDANAFSNYYSHYNSLRISKGLIWALLLLPLLAYSFHYKQNVKTFFSYGILIGLTATSLLGIRERFIFTGLFDYTTDFRITSSFYSMHTGGAHLDAYLILTMPFICFLPFKSKKTFSQTILASLIFTLSLYTLLVTYTRGTYIALLVSTIILTTALFINKKKSLLHNWKKMLWLPISIIIITVVALPIIKGSFIQHRFKQTYQEIDIRSNHWLNAYNMMDSDFLTTLFGMGIGSFPRTYLWNNVTNQVPSSFKLQQEENTQYLQVGSGAPLYIEQKINISPDTDYKLSLDYRSHGSNHLPSISICEKAIQNSFKCYKLPLKSKNKQTNWQHLEHSFNSKDLGKNTNSFTSKPTKLVIQNSTQNTILDFNKISLISPQENELVKNGDFSQQMDFWFFTADDHIPWRTENLLMEILFDQGWLGMISFLLLSIKIISSLYQNTLKHDLFSSIALSSIIGFQIIGITDSPFDMPMITLLFFLIYFITLIDFKNQYHPRKASNYNSGLK